jgi:nucleoside-diphosphate-sugar epimerase
MMAEIVVTGATGFLGAEVVRELLSQRGVVVRAVGRRSEQLNQMATRFGSHAERLRLQPTDLLDLRSLPSEPEAVIHSAGVRQATDVTPEAMVQGNVEATLRLVRCAADAGCRRFVYVSTQAVYGSSGAPWTEDASPNSQGSYALTKYAGERIALAFGDALEVVILRLSRLYGATPNTHWKGLPGGLAHQALRGDPLTIFGSGEQRMDLVHVSDAARAVVLAATARTIPSRRIYNVGSGESASVNEVVDVLREAAADRGMDPLRVRRIPDHPRGGDRRLELDISRITEELGWRPTRTLIDGLGEYFDARPS